MKLSRAVSLVLFLTLGTIALGSCGGSKDDGTKTPTGVTNPTNSDFIKIAVNGGAETTHTEASGLPMIDCDPRVDWASFQVILWDNFTSSGGPNGYDTFLDIMFPVADSVGTYTVQGDMLQALFYNGTNYFASPIYGTSSGTVQVTRSDTRIEGTFSLTVVDTSQSTSVDLTGDFGVDRGFSLSCP